MIAGNRGFSLVELMIGLVLVGILMGIGVPLFRDFILDQQLRAASSDLRVALTTARSEAVKRNRTIELKPLDEDDGWGAGWVIESPILDDPDLLVHQQSGEVVITTDPADATMRFSPMGRAVSVVTYEVDVGPEGNRSTGCLVVALDGRITSTKGTCPDG